VHLKNKCRHLFCVFSLRKDEFPKNPVGGGLNMYRKGLILVLYMFLFVSFARAQTADVTVQLSEQFFDALLTAIFRDSKPLEFPLSQNVQTENSRRNSFVSSFAETKNENPFCNETVRLLREVDGVRTTVRFRNGQISAPIAFSGNYNPPLIGCMEFRGVADTVIELGFDREKQTLVGRAKVQNVNLSGTGGIGGSLIARLVQGSIDKKINPINILEMNKVSFVVPIQNAGSVRMRAVGLRHEVANGVLNVHITYEFQKVE
jgi:hypothetical protein